MGVEFRIVNIGTLSSNPFWNEAPGVRTAHATTTLVRDGDRRILVDPSLPPATLAARLYERSGLSPEDITDVFCTTLRATHRWGIAAFGSARWLCHEPELQAARGHLEALDDSARRIEKDFVEDIQAELKLLERFQPAPDKLTPGVHLYPLPGPSAGSAGLLLATPTQTIMVAGDAAVTSEHVEAGRVWGGCADVEAAMESLQEIVEIADIIVCGHDNVMLSPTRWMR